MSNLQLNQYRSQKKARPKVSLSLKAFDQGLPFYLHMVTAKNSPLTPVLRHGIMVLRQAGILDHIDKKWFGTADIEGKPTPGMSSLTVLSTGTVDHS